MTDLEFHYRRLLRVYPAGHRAAYEEEMIGVLMDGAEPGRRLPSPADTLDLLRAGLTVRLGRSFNLQRGTGWRDAAAVTGLLIALALAAIATGRFLNGLSLLARFDDPLRAYGMNGVLLIDPAARSIIWVLVSGAALLGLRHIAAVLAASGILIELATVFFWVGVAPWQSLRLTWAPTVAVLAFAAFATAVRARPAPAVLGRRGMRWIVAATAFVVVTQVVLTAGSGRISVPFSTSVLEFWIPLVLLIAAVRSARPAVRRRVAVLAFASLTVPFVFLLWWDWTALSFAVHITPGIVTSQLIVLVLTPVVLFAGGLATLWAGERFMAVRRGQVTRYE
ncbi:hypothetical protein AB0M02_03225 [Actinoplanes sp. NPDC051861]|uniref:hypothetical protein n=1 Tax=Actinoplanes sp. NPDC051861 TaxID=3155170 RepID=UPI0034127045